MAFFCPSFGSKESDTDCEDVDLCHVSKPGTSSAESDSFPKERISPKNHLNSTQIGPNTPLIALQTFEPTLEDEIKVSKGDLLYGLYCEGNWVYVVGREEDNLQKEGFVPLSILSNPFQDSYQHPNRDRMNNSCLSLYKSFNFTSTLFSSRLKSSANLTRQSQHDGKLTKNPGNNHHQHSTMSLPRPFKFQETQNFGEERKQRNAKWYSFKKRPQGFFFAAYPFRGVNEDDLSMRPKEIVLLLNSEDQDWFWVQSTESLKEGFVPSSYISPLPSFARRDCVGNINEEEGKMFYKSRIIQRFVPEQRNDLRVEEGDYVLTQEDPFQKQRISFVWAYAISSGKSGFLPVYILQNCDIDAF